MPYKSMGTSVIQSYSTTESCEATKYFLYFLIQLSVFVFKTRCYLSDHALFCVYSFLPETDSLKNCSQNG